MPRALQEAPRRSPLQALSDNQKKRWATNCTVTRDSSGVGCCDVILSGEMEPYVLQKRRFQAACRA
jgi:hypothetical protein